VKVAFSGTRVDPLRDEVGDAIRSILAATGREDEVWVGDCPTGVDRCVRATVRSRRMLVVAHAPWDEFGTPAGPLRNSLMANAADVLYAFPERHEVAAGSGTWDCIRAFEATGPRSRVHIHGCWRRL
jgi:hypothetical protein